MPPKDEVRHNYMEIGIPARAVYPLNKNQGRRKGRRSIYVPVESQTAREELEKIISLASDINGFKWVRTKTWVRLHLRKPGSRQDAINYVDDVCDAIARAIGVDDRWFCIDRVDWSIERELGLDIAIWQDSTTDHGICKMCSRIRPMTAFRLSSITGKHYMHRCMECDHRYERARRARKRRERHGESCKCKFCIKDYAEGGALADMPNPDRSAATPTGDVPRQLRRAGSS